MCENCNCKYFFKVMCNILEDWKNKEHFNDISAILAYARKNKGCLTKEHKTLIKEIQEKIKLKRKEL